jgi:hypothetical protein
LACTRKGTCAEANCRQNHFFYTGFSLSRLFLIPGEMCGCLVDDLVGHVSSIIDNTITAVIPNAAIDQERDVFPGSSDQARRVHRTLIACSGQKVWHRKHMQQSWLFSGYTPSPLTLTKTPMEHKSTHLWECRQ